MNTKKMIGVVLSLLLAVAFVGCEEKVADKGEKAKGEKASTESAAAEPAANAAGGEAAATAEPESVEHVEPEPAGEASAETVALVHQPGAKVGEWTMCPSMKGKFEVQEGQASTDYKGQAVYFCCKGCEEKFQQDPEGALAVVNADIDAHNAGLAGAKTTE